MGTFIITLFIAIIGFTFIIFIHELGHFLAARRVGIHVETFSIGIGWRVVKLYTDSKGTDYILSLLPLGGYVKMKGQEDVPSLKQDNTDKDSFTTKKPWQRLFVVLAGVFMNFLSAFPLIFLAYFIGVPFFTNTVGSINPEFPISDSNLKTGDTIVAINEVPVASYEDIITTTVFAGNQEILHLSVLDENGQQRTVSTVAKKQIGIPFPQLGIRPYPSATIRGLSSSSVYYKAGLRDGMNIQYVEIHGIQYTTVPSIAQIQQRMPGEDFTIQILPSLNKPARRIENLKIQITETAEQGFMLESKINTIKNGAAYAAGIRSGDIILSVDESPIRGYQDLLQVMDNYRLGFFEKDLANQANIQGATDKKPRLGQAEALQIEVDRNTRTLHFEVFPRYNEANEAFYLGIYPLAAANGGSRISYIAPEMRQQIPGLRENDILLSYETVNADLKQAEIQRDSNVVRLQYSDKAFPKKLLGLPIPMSSGEKIIRYNFTDALIKTFPLFVREMKETVLFVYKLIAGSVPVEAIGGPIAVVDAFQSFSKIKTSSYFLLLFAKISLSIAILNLLPIPVLDGGHAVFILYEMLRRKPAPAGLIRTLNFIGFVLLIFLMIFVNYSDIVRIINR